MLIYEHPEHAQRKVVILYEEISTRFFLGFWAQWQRILRRNIAAGSLDGSLDKDASVQKCEEAECDQMLEHYKSSLTFVNVQGFDGIGEILRLSALPPPRATSTKPSTRKVESPLVPAAEKGHDEHQRGSASMEKAGRGGRGAGGRGSKRVAALKAAAPAAAAENEGDKAEAPPAPAEKATDKVAADKKATDKAEADKAAADKAAADKKAATDKAADEKAAAADKAADKKAAAADKAAADKETADKAADKEAAD